ncbi:MAG: O-antigen ligase family protein [Sedimentisphaerales bacterium]|nr:O-antigen ligase family protein [Sedimentisphaerales bacterium]
MALFIAIFCAVVIVLCVPLVFWKPKWVFYIFLVSAVFNSIFAGYINQAGNLGLPLTWAPADFLSVMTLFAALFVRKESLFRSNIIKKCILVLAVLSVLSLIQGLVMYPRDALTHSRVVHFAAAGLFALKYFTDYSSVRGLLKFSFVLILMMFAFHVLIRLGIYDAPINEADRIVDSGGLAGERGTQTLIPMLYLILVSMAIGRFSSKTGSFLISIIMLIAGIGGIVLSETRSTYGAMAVLVISALIFVRARIKNTIIFTIASMIVVIAAVVGGFDFLSRFRTDYGRGYYTTPSLYELRHSWRGIEYETIQSSYKEAPYFLFTGRGIGAMHPAPTGPQAIVAFYHSEYLGWLDRCGLIGLIGVLVLLAASLFRSFVLARSEIPFLRYLGTTFFLLTIALAADGVFHPIFSHYRGASLLICFAAVTANWRDIYVSLIEEQEIFLEEPDLEFDENYDSEYEFPHVIA